MPKTDNGLQEKVKRLLDDELKDGQALIETLPNGHVCGHVVSSEFKKKDYQKRRRRIREILDAGLKKSELDHISTLLTYTPAEWTVAQTDS